LFSRQQILDEELNQIIIETKSAGKTPTQTLSRVLQELRDDKKISMNSFGRYRLIKS
jgi:putative restriction endonuclease